MDENYRRESAGDSEAKTRQWLFVRVNKDREELY